MKSILFLTMSLLIVLSSCKKQQFESQTAGLSSKGTVPSVSNSVAPNKWGTLVNKSAANENQSSWGTQVRLNTAAKRVAEANALGVTYYRMGLNATDWLDAANGTSYQNSKITEFQAAKSGNLVLILNILYQSTDNGAVNFPSGTATASSGQVYNYGTAVQDVLTKLSNIQYKPAFIVVENEEDNQNYYNIDVSGQIDQYKEEMKKAKSVCNAFTWWNNTTGVPVTNGGITARKCIYATYHYYTDVVPNTAVNWQSWAYSVLPMNYYYGLINGTPPTINGVQVNKESYMTIKSQIKTVDTLLDFYAGTLHLSYINMHWYEPVRARSWDPSKNGNISPYDAGTYGGLPNDRVVQDGLKYASNFIKARTSNTPVMSNEIGQLTLIPCLTQSLLYTANNYLSYAVLYDGDDDDYTYGAKAYHNTTATTSGTNVVTSSSLRGIGTTANTQISQTSPSLCQ